MSLTTIRFLFFRCSIYHIYVYIYISFLSSFFTYDSYYTTQCLISRFFFIVERENPLDRDVDSIVSIVTSLSIYTKIIRMCNSMFICMNIGYKSFSLSTRTLDDREFIPDLTILTSFLSRIFLSCSFIYSFFFIVVSICFPSWKRSENRVSHRVS